MTFLVLFWEHNAHPRGRQTLTSMIQGRRLNLKEWVLSFHGFFPYPKLFFPTVTYLLEVTFFLKSLDAIAPTLTMPLNK